MTSLASHAVGAPSCQVYHSLVNGSNPHLVSAKPPTMLGLDCCMFFLLGRIALHQLVGDRQCCITSCLHSVRAINAWILCCNMCNNECCGKAACAACLPLRHCPSVRNSYSRVCTLLVCTTHDLDGSDCQPACLLALAACLTIASCGWIVGVRFCASQSTP